MKSYVVWFNLGNERVSNICMQNELAELVESLENTSIVSNIVVEGK